MIETGDEFAGVINNVCGAMYKIDGARDRLDTLDLDKPSKGNREALAALTAARSNMWLALGSLIEA